MAATHRRVLALLLAVSVLLLAVPPRLALAQWSFEQYGAVVSAGEAAFDGGNYTEAVARYREGYTMLEAALQADEIPADAVGQATVELALLDYKLAVALQRNGECDAALASFERQASAADVPEVIAPALPVRIAEAGSCAVDQALESGGIEAARTALERVEAAQLAHPVGATAGDLAAEASAAQTGLQTARQHIVDATVARTRETIASGRCADAEAELEALGGFAPTEPELESLRGELDAQCGLTVHDWAPWVVVGAGGLLVIAGLAVEGGFGGDLDDFHSARSDCSRGSIAACDEALELHDDLSARQPVPTALIVSGVLVAGGGVTWWLLTHVFELDDGEEATALAPTPSVVPSAGGAQLGLGWRFDL